MRFKSIIFSILFLIFPILSSAMTCPDPQNSSLQWGEVPKPWEVSPFSMNDPQSEEGTQFVKANILVAGYGRGVACTYQNSVGTYTIWWQTLIKIPPRINRYWVDSLGGFECSASIDLCAFFPAK